MNRLQSVTGMFVVLLLVAGLPGCQPGGENGGGTQKSNGEAIRVAYITNGPASFWDVAEKGAQAAGRDFDVQVDVFMPTDDVAGQKRIVEDLLIKGIAGIAISPIDPAGQTDLLNSAAEQMLLLTHDSDAPESQRLCYIGMDNYDAGWICGEVVREALPAGGKIILCVGRLDQLNARLRRQGVVDAVLGRTPDATRFDEPGKSITEGAYTILETRVDGFDFAKAKADAVDSIAKYPDLSCFVGLFAYNPPLCLEAVKEAGKLNQIKIVGFDEDQTTLQGIIDGEVHGTVVQNPYMYGYDSVRVLAALARGNSLEQALPGEAGITMIEQKKKFFPARVVKKQPAAEKRTTAHGLEIEEVEVEAFRARLNELTQ